MAQDQHDTIIGAQVQLTGTIKTNGSIFIFGGVEGEISSESTVVIGEGATVVGPVSAKSIELAGTVHGHVVAREQVELGPKSSLHGDLTAGQLTVKPGARFNGTCHMQDERPTRSSSKHQVAAEH
jgi:cytoskeletal protein CcmA (bactofilin family)